MNLKTDYKNISWSGLRKYRLINNEDGTVSFQDVTQYYNVADSNVLANVLNQANDAINRMMNGEIFYTEAEVDALLALKQSVLTFDNVPTLNSANPVRSDGIKSALDALSARIDNLDVFSFHVCTAGEYDPTTGQPTIQNPETGTFYLVPSGTTPDVFKEWIYVNNTWELFGSTQVDLSNYVTKADLEDALDDKQDVLTFDNVPTENSSNPVTSGGVYGGLAEKSDIEHIHDDRYYTEEEVIALLGGKSDSDHTHDSRYYTETEVDTLLGYKADIDDTYTKTEVDTLLSGKSDSDHTHDSRYYTETEVDTLLGYKADSDAVLLKRVKAVTANTDGTLDALVDGTAIVRTTSSVNTSLYNALGDTYAYVLQMSYDVMSANARRVQIAYPYNRTIAKCSWRVYNNSTWGAWYVIDINALSDYLPLTGGTLTGNLVLNDKSLTIKNPNADISASTVSANEYNLMGMTDKNGRYIAYMQSANFANGKTELQLAARKYINNANVDNKLNIGVDASGNRTLSVSDSSLWRNALGASSGIWGTNVGGTGGTDSGWQTLTSSYCTGNIYVRRIGAWIQITSDELNLKTALTVAKGVSLLTLSSNYRPGKMILFTAGCTFDTVYCRITTGGVVGIFKNRQSSSLPTTSTFYISAMYFA